MWLRNWYSLLNGVFLSRTTDTALPETNPSDTPPISYRDVNGYWSTIKNQFSYVSNFTANILTPGKFAIALGFSKTASQTSSAFTIILGTGTTPVTINDYCIETPITSGLALASGDTALANKTELNNGVYSFKTRAAINNTSAANIVINEIALNAPFYATSQGASGAACVYREVLSTPITLEPGDTALVEFEWNAPIYAAPTP